MADSQGRVCPRSAFDYSSGCCRSEASQYSCESCNLDDSCCSIYEHCVSCCMAPANDPESKAAFTSKGFQKPETGNWEDPFEYCRAVCRTTSRSTEHENDFIDERRYCFSSQGRPKVEKSGEKNQETTALPPQVAIMLGRGGLSCDDVCTEIELKCSAKYFEALNNCNMLRSKFACEAGCGFGEKQSGQVDKETLPAAASYPGYVVNGAANQMWPAYCFLKDNEPDCAGNAESVQRLCPCVATPPEGSGGDGGGEGVERRTIPNKDSDRNEKNL